MQLYEKVHILHVKLFFFAFPCSVLKVGIFFQAKGEMIKWYNKHEMHELHNAVYGLTANF